MRGVFKATGTIAAVTTKFTFCTLTTVTNPIEILSARVTAQDEDTSEQMFIELNRANGSGTGTTKTPRPLEEGSAAATTTSKHTITTVNEPTYDAIDYAIAAGGANKLAGWEYVPMPEERAIVKASDSVGLRLVDDVANATDFTYEITFREIG